jgi:hypothetical protein
MVNRLENLFFGIIKGFCLFRIPYGPLTMLVALSLTLQKK